MLDFSRSDCVAQGLFAQMERETVPSGGPFIVDSANGRNPAEPRGLSALDSGLAAGTDGCGNSFTCRSP